MSTTPNPAQPGLCPHGVPQGPEGRTDCPICRARNAQRPSQGTILRNWLILLGGCAAIAVLAIWLL